MRALVFAPFLLSAACASSVPPVVRPPTKPTVEALQVATADDVTAPIEAPPPDPRIPVGKDTRLLVFGDSMVNTGIGLFLKKRVERAGGHGETDSVASSTARIWNRNKRIEWLLEKTNPDVVVVVLGANEVFIPFPQATADEIKSIVKRLGGRKCVWVGPTVWKNQTGVVEVQRDNSGPCQYFDSQTVKLTRQPDGIHPDYEGGRDWAKAVWAAHFVAKDAPPPVTPPPTQHDDSNAVSAR